MSTRGPPGGSPRPLTQVLSLKQAVEASQGEAFPAERQVLVYKGKILGDQTTLEQAEVSEAGFLVVTVKKAKAKQPAASPPKVEAAEAAPAAPAAPAAKEAPPAPTPSPAPEGAPAARAEGAASGAPVASEEGLVQGAASNLATGSALEAAVSSICEMGFPKEQVMKAMRAAFNNPDRAVEYLMNGIPEQEPDVPQAAAPILTGAGGEAGAGAGAGAGVGSGSGPNTRPLNMFGGMGEGAEGGDAGGGALGFLRYNPQFQQLRQMVQANPQILQPMLQELGKQNPSLMNIISENQNEFLRLVSEAGDGAGAGAEEGADAGGPQGGDGFPTAQVQISQDDKEAIDRLEGLGFDRLLCIEAFFACEKNESLAANYLLEHGHEDMSA